MNPGLWADGLGPHRLALLGGSTAPETAAVASLEATPAAQRAPAVPWRDCWVQGSRQRLPSGTFAMKGSRGQYAVVVPSAKVIVVRRGFDPLDARFDIDRFTHDALGVLKGEGRRR